MTCECGHPFHKDDCPECECDRFEQFTVGGVQVDRETFMRYLRERSPVWPPIIESVHLADVQPKREGDS